MPTLFRAALGALLCISLFAHPARADEEAHPSIAVADWRIALFQSKAAEEEDQRMQQENLELVTRATELEQEIEAKGRSLEKDQAILSEEEKIKLQTELGRSAREFEMLRFRLQQIQAEAEARFVASQREHIDQAMKTLADRYGLDFVFERQALVYGRKVRNLTDELITELNKLQ